MTVPKEKPQINLRIPDKSKIKLDGFKDVSVKDNVTVIVKGTVVSLSEDADSWDPGKRMGVEIASVKIVPPEKTVKMSIEDAVKKTRRTVA